MPLGRQLSSGVGEALDSAWRRACTGELDGGSSWDRRRVEAECVARQEAALRLKPDERGLLPYRRGALSRAWQRLLDADLYSQDGAPSRRPAGAAGAAARDGEAGAAWAAGRAGDELLLLLPHWVATHWTAAQRGLGTAARRARTSVEGVRRPKLG